MTVTCIHIGYTISTIFHINNVNDLWYGYANDWYKLALIANMSGTNWLIMSDWNYVTKIYCKMAQIKGTGFSSVSNHTSYA